MCNIFHANKVTKGARQKGRKGEKERIVNATKQKNFFNIFYFLLNSKINISFNFFSF